GRGLAVGVGPGAEVVVGAVEADAGAGGGAVPQQGRDARGRHVRSPGGKAVGGIYHFGKARSRTHPRGRGTRILVFGLELRPERATGFEPATYSLGSGRSKRPKSTQPDVQLELTRTGARLQGQTNSCEVRREMQGFCNGQLARIRFMQKNAEPTR